MKILFHLEGTELQFCPIEAAEGKDTGYRGFCELYDLQNAYCNPPENIALVSCNTAITNQVEQSFLQNTRGLHLIENLNVDGVCATQIFFGLDW